MGVEIHTSWFSDTVAIVAQPVAAPRGADSGAVQHNLVATVASSVCWTVSFAARQKRPLFFRGVIALGNAALVNDGIYFGPAISEAASLYELADGAFAWLAPSAAAAGRHQDDGSRNRVLTWYDVPLKDGRSIRTPVVRPYWEPTRIGKDDSLCSTVERTMSKNRLDVAIKRQNTLRFVRYVDSAPRR